jgi:hypothetical protein
MENIALPIAKKVISFQPKSGGQHQLQETKQVIYPQSQVII